MRTTFRLREALDHSLGAYHWRSHGKAEVDLVVVSGASLYPIEVKSKSHLNLYDARGILALRETYGDIVQPGIILYAGEL